MKLTLALLLFTLATLTRADFDDDDIEGDYIRIIGDPDDCPGEIEFDDDDLTIEADDIEVKDRECTGGEIRLSKNPSNTAATTYFRERRDDVGDFLAGPVSGDLRCGSDVIRSGEQVILLETEDDISFEWRDVFGKETELERRDGGTITIDDDTKYMILGESCFYRQARIFEDSPDDGDDSGVCFPGSSLVRVRDGVKRMDELQIGDEVEVGNGDFSEVFAFTHRDARGKAKYVGIETDAGHKLVATETHFVYADGIPVPAKLVKIGQMMQTGEGKEVRVEKVERVKAKGLYNPQTVHGDIIVDGLRATTYTTAVEMKSAHALLAPLRALWSATGWAMDIKSIL